MLPARLGGWVAPLLLLWLWPAGPAAGQGPADTLANPALSPVTFHQLVLRYHPVARTADLQADLARAEVVRARGAFDPVLSHSAGQKRFGGTDYYYYSRPEIKWPTWLGAELSAGFEYLSGQQTDPQQTLGQTHFLGIAVPLGRNLGMDKRRAALQTARVLQQASAAEKTEALNNLLLEAMNQYWDWVRLHQQCALLTEAVRVSQRRLEYVRQTWSAGERAAIDTSDALAQALSLQVQETEARTQARNALLLLETFAWQPSGLPLELPGSLVPDLSLPDGDGSAWTPPSLDSLLPAGLASHPVLQLADFKIRALEIDKRLKFQELLPSMTVRYNLLGKGYDLWKTVSRPMPEYAYRYGISVSIPLLFSEGRGAYRSASLKLAQANLERQQKQAGLAAKIRSRHIALVALGDQLRLHGEALRQYEALQRAEEIRLRTGEGSLLLVNLRESRTLEARQKWVDLQVKYRQAGTYLLWASGRLVSGPDPWSD